MNAPYWFFADGRMHSFESYRQMYYGAKQHAPQLMWFTDERGRNHRVRHLAGQEAFGIGTKR